MEGSSYSKRSDAVCTTGQNITARSLLGPLCSNRPEITRCVSVGEVGEKEVSRKDKLSIDGEPTQEPRKRYRTGEIIDGSRTIAISRQVSSSSTCENCFTKDKWDKNLNVEADLTLSIGNAGRHLDIYSHDHDEDSYDGLEQHDRCVVLVSPSVSPRQCEAHACSDTIHLPVHGDCVRRKISLLPFAPQLEITSEEVQDSSSASELYFRNRNPFHNPSVLTKHIRALRVESALLPFKQILSRLMSHPTYNRKGIFNFPVNPLDLGLTDYFSIVKKPMDLGTIRSRLHALKYSDQSEVVSDVRLVFMNAMLFNPPGHIVHDAAKHLLRVFNEGYAALSTGTSHRTPSSLGNNTDRNSHTFAFPLDTHDHESAVSTFSAVVSDNSFSNSAEQEMELRTQPINLVASVERSINSDLFVGLEPKLSASTTALEPQTTECLNVGPVNPIVYSSALSNDSSLLPLKNKTAALNHSCQTCLGRICVLCKNGCLALEPTCLICAGPGCSGTKIRKGSTFYCAEDGTKVWCQKCYSNLSAILPHDSGTSSSDVRYKRDLLKRKNEEEVVENWVTCIQCTNSMHQTCVMFNETLGNTNDFVCLTCTVAASITVGPQNTTSARQSVYRNRYTYVCGSELPVKLDDMQSEIPSNAESIPHNPISLFIEAKVRLRMSLESCHANAEHTVLVRVISDCEKSFSVPDVIRRHFRMQHFDNEQDGVSPRQDKKKQIKASRMWSSSPVHTFDRPPKSVNYNSKVIALFQRTDEVDVCVFCMYVQEYDNILNGKEDFRQKRRVYVAYLDSVEHFRPRECRTSVYHEILVSYLATARVRGYETAHIWACPPARGNSFVFWGHPSSQRTPTRDRLLSWYHSALSQAVECGVVTDVSSLYEYSFQKYDKPVAEASRDGCEGTLLSSPSNSEQKADESVMVCPPLLDGDLWMNEALRVHSTCIARHLKSKKCSSKAMPSKADKGSSRCPAVEVATLLENKVINHPSSAPFLRPVNAAALKLFDYHEVISKPMDLGSIHSRCLLGEFDSLADFVDDVTLVFDNAMLYNPKGHFIHTMAADLRNIFFKELNELAIQWRMIGVGKDQPESQTTSSLCAQDDPVLWIEFSDVSMRLSAVLEIPIGTMTMEQHTDKGSVTYKEESNVVGNTKNQNTHFQKELDFPLISLADQNPGHPVSSAFANLSCHLQSMRCNSTSAFQVRQSTDTSTLSSLKSISGPDVIARRMAGDDVRQLDKNCVHTEANNCGKKNKFVKKKKLVPDSDDGNHTSSTTKRKESWLGDEVGTIIRRMRRDFFVCSLLPSKNLSDADKEKIARFEAYTIGFESYKQLATPQSKARPSIADARHELLEFFQYHGYQFDTIRRAKHSTAMLLYHVHTFSPDNLVPTCSTCLVDIEYVRWHKLRRSVEENRRSCLSSTATNVRITAADRQGDSVVNSIDLCSGCYKNVDCHEDYIPIRVSFKRTSDNATIG